MTYTKVHKKDENEYLEKEVLSDKKERITEKQNLNSKDPRHEYLVKSCVSDLDPGFFLSKIKKK
jgi:hypothetical protein